MPGSQSRLSAQRFVAAIARKIQIVRPDFWAIFFYIN